MTNKDLLKQAIAEAKTIREAAIANAKEALEESLTPHLKDMLAAKLQEMEEADEMSEAPSHEEADMDEGNAEDMEEVVITEEESEEESSEEESEEGEEEKVEEEDLNIEDMTVEDLKTLIQDMISQELGTEEEEESLEDMPVDGVEDMEGIDSEEEIDINELLAEIESIDESDELEEEAEELLESEETESTELEEALRTIEILRGQLQEVNLLNAKLLYVNKVFKSSNLTESQKVNVITAFDKAETVKEVKLVYETVSKNVTSKPVAIREHKSFASKAIGSTSKEVLPQVNEQVARWQKLAGIIK